MPLTVEIHHTTTRTCTTRKRVYTTITQARHSTISQGRRWAYVCDECEQLHVTSTPKRTHEGQAQIEL